MKKLFTAALASCIATIAFVRGRKQTAKDPTAPPQPHENYVAREKELYIPKAAIYSGQA